MSSFLTRFYYCCSAVCLSKLIYVVAEPKLYRVKLNLLLCVPFGDYELDMLVESFNYESTTKTTRFAFEIENGADEVSVHPIYTCTYTPHFYQLKQNQKSSKTEQIVTSHARYLRAWFDTSIRRSTGCVGFRFRVRKALTYYVRNANRTR